MYFSSFRRALPAQALGFAHIFFNPEGGCVFQPRVREALGATLGFRGKFRSTPKVLHPCPNDCIATINGRNPVGVDASGGSITQGCSKTREPWAGGRNTFGIQEHKKCGQRAGLFASVPSGQQRLTTLFGPNSLSNECQESEYRDHFSSFFSNVVPNRKQ